MYEKVKLNWMNQNQKDWSTLFKYWDLPSINLIVLSHFHGDHFDQVAEGDPDKSMSIITTSHLAKDWFRGAQIIPTI